MSEAPVEAPKPQKYESYNPETYKTDEQKKEEVTSAPDKECICIFTQLNGWESTVKSISENIRKKKSLCSDKFL